MFASFRSVLRKLKGNPLGPEVPGMDAHDPLARLDVLSELPTETETKMLKGVAAMIAKYGMETPAIMFLECVKPVAVFGSSVALVLVAPYLEILGIPGYKYAALFQKRANVERLLRIIEEQAKRSKR